MRVLISISEKNGIVSFIKDLKNLFTNIEIISTSGTNNYLKNNKINSIEVSDYTGFPEILDGRLKTLHPKVFGGILSKKNHNHLVDLEKHDIKKIDIVICNLYPFEKVIKSENFAHEEAIENIDIGGVSLLRAAAKNYQDVLVISDPEDYSKVIKSISKDKIPNNLKKDLAMKVFKMLSEYDNSISNYLSGRKKSAFFDNGNLTELRYGENPHQLGYINKNNTDSGIANSLLHSGKIMSYNNYLDADVAYLSSNNFAEKCVSVVKHTNVCGLSINRNQLKAFRDAINGDKVSSFGGILGFNTELEEVVAQEIIKSFFEIVVAPKYNEKTMSILRSKKNLRIIEAKYSLSEDLQFRSISGGYLAQSQNIIDDYENHIVTDIAPTKQQIEDSEFAWKLCSFIKSNSILLVKNRTLLGMGAGQPNRIMSVKIAGEVAGAKSADSVMASDAFFPFPDSIIKADELGVKCIIQPGGSINDDKVIEEANRRGISMIFTKQRRFTH